MINVLDRVPTNANRKKITFEADPEIGVNYATVEYADTPIEVGTPLNKALMIAIQGFYGNTIVFNIDGSITETNADGHTKVTTFYDGYITEVFTAGTYVATKTITFNIDGSISEVIS